MAGKRDLVEVACKVMGVLCALRSALMIPWAVGGLRSLGKGGLDVTMVICNIAMVVLPLLAAVLLLKCSQRIAAHLIPVDSSLSISSGSNWQRDLYSMCLRVVGAVVLVKGIPELIRLVSATISRKPDGALLYAPVSGSLLAAIVHLALGVYLIGGGPLIVKLALKGSMKESDIS